MKNILIIDDEVNVGLLLSKFLTRNGFNVSTATSGATAAEALKNTKFNLVLCDFRLEDTDGREILKKIKKEYPETGVIIITGYSDIKMAVELIKLGAYDYITKPLYPDEILTTINKAIETQKALNETSSQPVSTNQAPAAEPRVSKKTIASTDFVVGTSRESKDLVHQIELVAPTMYSVIIIGESGTGKESVAKSIHIKSNRADKPFKEMDCCT